jgi:hypothetical protein
MNHLRGPLAARLAIDSISWTILQAIKTMKMKLLPQAASLSRRRKSQRACVYLSPEIFATRFLRGALSRLYLQIPSRCFISSLFSRYLPGALSRLYFLVTLVMLYLEGNRGALSRLYFQIPSRCFISSLSSDTFAVLYLVSIIFRAPSRCVISSLSSRYLRGALSHLYFQIPSRCFISSLSSGFLRGALSRLYILDTLAMLYLEGISGALYRPYFQIPSRCFISSPFPDTFAVLYLVSISRYLRGALSCLYLPGSFAALYLVSIFRVPLRRFMSSLYSGYPRNALSPRNLRCVISSLSSRYLRGALSRLHFPDTFAMLYLVSIFWIASALSRLYIIFRAPSRCVISFLSSRSLRGALSRLYLPDTFAVLYLVSIFRVPSRCFISSQYSGYPRNALSPRNLRCIISSLSSRYLRGALSRLYLPDTFAVLYLVSIFRVPSRCFISSQYSGYPRDALSGLYFQIPSRCFIWSLFSTVKWILLI